MGLARVKTFVLENSPAWLVVSLMRRFVTKSDYQSKRESITIFQRANVAYGAKRQNRSARLLRVAFGLLGDEFPTSYARLIIGATNQTQLDASRRGALSSEILDATKSLAVNITDATGWYQLSRGLFSVGYFRAAWVARENSIELSIREGEVGGAAANAVGRAIQAHLERRNFTEVEQLLQKSANDIKPNSLRDIRDYLDMMENKYVMPPLDPASPDFDAEKLFSELITGKSVALVGPGSPSGHYGDEIDSADTVVRIKYVGREHLPPQEFHGHRTTIIYLNQTELDGMLDRDSKFALRNKDNEIQVILSYRFANLKKSVVPVFSTLKSPYINRTTAHSGLIALFNLLCNFPKQIMVYGFDFYANVGDYNIWHTNFLSSSGDLLALTPGIVFNYLIESKSFRVSGFADHDPVSNFCFAQNLYKAGLFEIEPLGASILALTPYQYVERLEDMLGDW